MAKQLYGVLIIHGFTGNLDCVRGIESSLKALGLPTRMPVMRGHGAQSPDALRGVTWHDWVADAEVALQDLLREVERVIVFGHSMGGLVALTLAAELGEAIDSMVVAAAAVQFTSPFAPGRPFYFLTFLMKRLIDKWDCPAIYADPVLAQYDTKYTWAPLNAIASLFEFASVTRRRLTDVSVPTRIIQSRKDTVVSPSSANIIYSGISTPAEQKRVVWFEETDHEMFLDCEREAAIAAVVDYVRGRISLEA